MIWVREMSGTDYHYSEQCLCILVIIEQVYRANTPSCNNFNRDCSWTSVFLQSFLKIIVVKS